MPVAGAGSPTLGDAPISVPHHWPSSLQHSHHSAAPHKLCTAQLLPLHTPRLFLLSWNVNILILSHIAHSLEFVNQRLDHFSTEFSSLSFEYSYMGTLYPHFFLHTAQPQIPTPLCAWHKQLLEIVMLSSLLHHFSLAMAPHQCHPTLRGQARNQTVSKHAYLLLTLIKWVGREKQPSANFTTRENEPGYFVPESKDVTPSPKNSYLDCAASLKFGVNLHIMFVNII